jgi:predicted TIM-barrel fold metal-dependent hydrolase
MVDRETNPRRELSRRELLRLGLAATLPISAVSCRGTGTPMKNDLTQGAIDGHMHVWTSDTERYPVTESTTKAGMVPATFEPQDLFAHTRPVGITRVVLIQMSYYGFDNRYMLDVLRQHPGVFSAVAVIDKDVRARETMLELRQQGVRGFRIQPGNRSPSNWLDGDGFRAMWQYGAEEGMAMCPLIQPKYLPAVGRMCEKLPETSVVIDHVGLVGSSGAVEKDLDSLCDLAKHKHVHVKLSAFYALGRKKPPYHDLAPTFRRVVDAFGPERLLWASDGPYQMMKGHTLRDSIDLIRSGLDFLSDSDRDWILRRTAERVFFS